MIKISKNSRNAMFLGGLCSVSYLAVYVARNVLSAVTPQMIAGGAYTEEYIGIISSLYFIFYAIGQLINGIIGDKIKAKYMMSFGLLLAGFTNVAFPFMAEYPNGAAFVYALTGFFLSMIYGPMTKVVSENTEPVHAVRCSLGYTLASLLGSPVAGLLAMLLAWQSAFVVSSVTLLLMAATCFVMFAVFEMKGIVRYGSYTPAKKDGGGVKVLFRRKIVKYSLVSIITGIMRTSVLFWLPTYISQYLDFSPQTSAGLFTVATLFISLVPFVTVFVYEKIGRDMDKTVLLMFVCALVSFVLTYFVELPALNVVFIVLAIMSSNGAATILWSIYCPSLYDTGLVSSATGFLDFLSYMSAAVANIIFADAINAVGWGNLILIWMGISAVGVAVSLPMDKIFIKKRIAATRNKNIE